MLLRRLFESIVVCVLKIEFAKLLIDLFKLLVNLRFRFHWLIGVSFIPKRDEATKYIEGITLYKKKITKTKSFTGFFGFIQTMASIRHMIYTIRSIIEINSDNKNTIHSSTYLQHRETSNDHDISMKLRFTRTFQLLKAL
ncbi:hypothetical protein Bhyg_15091 [Pseudolycoriella hygida]|uniref:Uncharacterized protein n=1 Tax=Pseudolycoriella hygida TaxID=35572 RepID=A0A9Q0MR74_9DIPT|nr:hypothetical protein Bhyg_15091 [Pseudolycoriella hygida]